MISIDTKKINSMYDYLRAETTKLTPSDGAFVFCRDDPLVAERVAELYDQRLINYIMITGGIGKDSGYLTELELSEAKWQAALMNIRHGIPSDKIYVEPRATNGGECSRYGIDTIVENTLPHDELIIVVHPTQIRRTEAVLKHIAREKQFQANYQRTGTRYNFNPESGGDQREAVGELLRLADWPAKGWCEKQSDLPLGLVEYARDLSDSWK